MPSNLSNTSTWLGWRVHCHNSCWTPEGHRHVYANITQSVVARTVEDWPKMWDTTAPVLSSCEWMQGAVRSRKGGMIGTCVCVCVCVPPYILMRVKTGWMHSLDTLHKGCDPAQLMWGMGWRIDTAAHYHPHHHLSPWQPAPSPQPYHHTPKCSIWSPYYQQTVLPKKGEKNMAKHKKTAVVPLYLANLRM